MALEENIKELQLRLSQTEEIERNYPTIERTEHILKLASRSLARRDNPELSKTERMRALERAKERLGINDSKISFENFPWSHGDYVRAEKSLFLSEQRTKDCSGEIHIFPGGLTTDKARKNSDIQYFNEKYIELFRGATNNPADISFSVAVYNRIPKEERQLIDLAISENPKLIHPHLQEHAQALFLNRVTKPSVGNEDERVVLEPEEITRNFSGISFVGYSYGATSIIQVLNYAQDLMNSHGISAEVQKEAFSQVLAVLIAPSSGVYEPDHLPINRITVASPLDERITGFLNDKYIGEMSLSVAWDNISPENLGHMCNGAWDKVIQPQTPEELDERTFFYTKLLPGRVMFSPSGKRYAELCRKGGHRLTPQVESMERTSPEILAAMIQVARNRGKIAKIDLEKIATENKIALIGAGKISLSLAEKLARSGYGVTLYTKPAGNDLKRQERTDARIEKIDTINNEIADKGERGHILFTHDPSTVKDYSLIHFLAGYPISMGMNGSDILKKNASLIEEYIGPFVKNNPNAVIINTVNPPDIITHFIEEVVSRQSCKNTVIGMASSLDSQRFNDAIKDALIKKGIYQEDLELRDAYVLGAHDNTMVPIFSGAVYGDKSLYDIFNQEEKSAIAHKTKCRGAEIIKETGHSDVEGPAEQLVMMTNIIMKGRSAIIPCCLASDKSAIGGRLVEFKGSDISMLADSYEIMPEEEAALENSSDSLKEQLDEWRLIL